MLVQLHLQGDIVREMPNKAALNLIKQGQAVEVTAEGAEKMEKQAKKAAAKERKMAVALKNKARQVGSNK